MTERADLRFGVSPVSGWDCIPPKRAGLHSGVPLDPGLLQDKQVVVVARDAFHQLWPVSQLTAFSE